MENRRDEWRLWIDSQVHSHDVLYERLDNRVHNAETVANEARAEFRSIRDEFKAELREIKWLINGDPTGKPGIKQDLAELKAAGSIKEKREGYRWTFWTALVPVVVVQFLILIGLLIVNWSNIMEYWKIHQHIAQAAKVEADTKHLKAERKRVKDLVDQGRD